MVEKIFKMVHRTDPSQEFLVRAKIDRQGVVDLIPLGEKGTVWITDLKALERGGDRFNLYHRLPPYFDGGLTRPIGN